MVGSRVLGKGDFFSQKSQKEILKLFSIWSGLLLVTWRLTLLTRNSTGSRLAGEERKAKKNGKHGLKSGLIPFYSPVEGGWGRF